MLSPSASERLVDPCHNSFRSTVLERNIGGSLVASRITGTPILNRLGNTEMVALNNSNSISSDVRGYDRTESVDPTASAESTIDATLRASTQLTIFAHREPRPFHLVDP